MARAPKKEERGFRYQKRDKETLKERANMKGGNYDTYIKPKFKQWKPKDGKNVIRILPPTWDDARHYGLDIFVNFNIGPDNQSYLSLSKHDRGPDPLAEARREAQADGDKEFAKKLNPSQRILYWIIDRMDEDEGPLLWAAPFTFDKSLSNLCIDEDTKDVIFIDDPANGRDVRFYKEGQGLTTKYDPSKMKVLKESNLAEDEGLEQEWLDFIQENPLPEVLNFYEYDHIKAAFGGQAGRDEDDDDDEKPARRSSRKAEVDEDEAPKRRTKSARDSEDDDEEPSSRSRRNAASAKRASEDDDDDEDAPKTRGPRRDQDPDDADDEEDEKPTRTRQRSRSRDDDADEDEDEKPKRRASSRREESDDDEDDAEEKPARSRRRVAEPDDEEDESPPPKSRRGKTDDDDEEGGGSLRQKLAARRRSRNSDDD